MSTTPWRRLISLPALCLMAGAVVFCGLYIHGKGQVGMAHPLHLLLYATLPLDVALNAEWLLN